MGGSARRSRCFSFICACGNGYEVDCTCPADLGKIDCAPFCVPNDESNCGACGNACEGLTCCLVGDVNDCVDTTTNNDNCNGCGQTCSDGLQCVGGNCTTTVPPPNTLTTNCGDTSANCETLGGLYDGGCQQFGLGTSGYGCTCGFGYNTNPSTGACECDQQDCGTTCTSINDFYNCGECGKECAAGESCAGANGCVANEGGGGGGQAMDDCGAAHVDCTSLVTGDQGFKYSGDCVLSNGSYVCGCSSGFVVLDTGGCGCAAGLTLCGETCVDIQSDNAHCSGCDIECVGNCMGGICYPPELPQ